MQTREGVWENSKVCVNPSRRRVFTQRLSSSPKLPRVSGYVNTASVLHFFPKYTTKIVLKIYIGLGVAFNNCDVNSILV